MTLRARWLDFRAQGPTDSQRGQPCWQTLSELLARLNSLYRTIERKAPNAKIIVVGYPQIVKNESTWICGADGALPTSTHQALNHAGDVLKSVLAARAAAHGFTFVDPPGPIQRP